MPLLTQEYFVREDIKRGGGGGGCLLMDLRPIQGEVVILLVTSCHGKYYNLQLGRQIGLNTDFAIKAKYNQLNKFLKGSVSW